jgi:hypothetical protein
MANTNILRHMANTNITNFSGHTVSTNILIHSGKKPTRTSSTIQAQPTPTYLLIKALFQHIHSHPIQHIANFYIVILSGTQRTSIFSSSLAHIKQHHTHTLNTQPTQT